MDRTLEYNLDQIKDILEKCITLQPGQEELVEFCNEKVSAEGRSLASAEGSILSDINGDLAATEGVTISLVKETTRLLCEKLDEILALQKSLQKNYCSDRKFRSLPIREKFIRLEESIDVNIEIHSLFVSIINQFWIYLPKSLKLMLEREAYYLSDRMEKNNFNFPELGSDLSKDENLFNFYKQTLDKFNLFQATASKLVSLVFSKVGDKIPLRSPEESFKQGFHEAMTGQTFPIDDLWDGIDAE